MAQIESVAKIGGGPVTLHSEEKGGIVRLLRDNPYMGGVAIVSTGIHHHPHQSQCDGNADLCAVCITRRVPVRL